MSNNYIEHAIREFKAAGWLDDKGEYKSEMQGWICKDVLELLEAFNGHGHSGTSAPYTINLFQKLALFEPIAPLTGKDDEWNEVEGIKIRLWQNNRCSHVFKEADGRAYDIGIKGKGRVYIEFPYTP